MNKILLYLSIAILTFSCSDNSDNPKTNVYEIRNIGELSTTEYTVGKIVKLNDSTEWYKFGDRKILLSIKAKIKAGVDLTQINDDDIIINGTQITIKLPPAKITSFTINPDDIKTEMEGVNGFRHKFTQKEKNAFLKQGEAAIKRDLAETGIIKDANDNTVAFLKDFYENLGFEKVTIKTKTIKL